MSGYWQDKRAVITGASAGLGRAVAGELHRQGARVVLSSRRSGPLADAAEQLGERARGVPGDVTSDDDVRRLCEQAGEWLGGIDIWVNAAGRSDRGAADQTSLEDYRELWELNFLASVRCAQAALPSLQLSRGHLVNVGSLASKVAPRWLGAYAASKFPLAAFSQQLRLEQQEAGVHVLLVCPGPLRRDDAGSRYDDRAAELPAESRQAGGAKLKTIDPHWLATRILKACQRRRAELVVPAKARLLAAITQLSPSWGDWLLRRNSS